VADALVDRFRAAFLALLNEFFPERKFLGFHRYSVTACDFDKQTFDGQPLVSKNGLPAVSAVPIRSPWKIELKPGSSVLVGFEAANPAYPFLAFADQLTLMAKATLRADSNIEIGEGASQPAARQGDMVLVPSLGLVGMFAVSPSGDPVPSPMNTMTPYQISITTVTSVPPLPAFPAIGNLPGIVSSGSPYVKTT
jgi:hypothetical protein